MNIKKNTIRIIIAILLIIRVLPCDAQKSNKNPAPPIAKIQVDTIQMHGNTLVDNYAWMKDKERSKKETIDYGKAENSYTDKMMKHTELLQEKLFTEIKDKIQETDLNVPVKKGNYYYYSRTEQGKQYPIYCRKKGNLKAKEEITLDVNLIAEGYKFCKVVGIQYSPSRQFLSFGMDTTGSEKYIQNIKNLKTGKLLKEKLGPAYECIWANDNKTLFYSTQNDAKEGSKLVYRHILGKSSDKDELIYTETQEGFSAHLGNTKNKKYIEMYISDGNINEVWMLDANNPNGKFKLILSRKLGSQTYFYPNDDVFYIRTNIDGAKNRKIMKVPINDPSKDNWTEFIPHRKSVFISKFIVFKNYITLHERENGLEKLRVINLTTNEDYYVEFPEPVYSVYRESNPNFDTETYRFYYTSFITPGTVYEFNMKTQKKSLLKQRNVLGGYNPSLYKSERTWANGRDGTKIPISLVYKKDLLKKDGSNPMYLYAYGSYGIGTSASFSSSKLSLLDRGFVYAIAHVRGGDDMGEIWHEQGKILNKKNTFYDYIDCAEHLMDKKYTSKEKLAGYGGSAGGMLMGVVCNLRPDLLKVVIANVPACDELNHMLDPTTPGVPYHYNEWGNPNIKKEFEYFLSWDAYYNIKKQNYPHILATTGLHDPRVPYWEPIKWIAKLRSNKTDSNSLLIKVNMAGHGGGSGRYDYYKEIAFRYAFIFDKLGIDF